MTTIAAIKIDGVASMAADTQSVAPGDILAHQQEKIHLLWGGSVAVASAGAGLASGVLASLAADTDGPIRNQGDLAATQIAAGRLCERFDARAKDLGWHKGVDEQGSPGFRSMRMIACTKSSVFAIYGDGAILEARDGEPVVIGSGEAFAYGAMSAALCFSSDAATVARCGVEAAVRYDPFTGGSASWVFWDEGGWNLVSGLEGKP